MIEEIYAYQATDGTLFLERDECLKYETQDFCEQLKSENILFLDGNKNEIAFIDILSEEKVDDVRYIFIPHFQSRIISQMISLLSYEVGDDLFPDLTGIEENACVMFEWDYEYDHWVNIMQERNKLNDKILELSRTIDELQRRN